MANCPLITLFIKGNDLSPFKGLVSNCGEKITLNLASVYPVPSESELRELYFSGKSANEQESLDATGLISEWKKENWGIDDSFVEVTEFNVGEGWLFLNFKVNNSAPVEFISYMTESYPNVFIYLGYNDLSNPVKYSFICRAGNVWPLKAEGMLTDYSGNAVFLDKMGEYRYARDSELIEFESINFNMAHSHITYLIKEIIELYPQLNTVV